MRKKLPPRRSNCSVSFALDYLGDRWTLLVIRDLLFKGKRHFREFLASDEGIASNILSSRLKLLEAAGMVSRRPDPQSARRVLYEPTEKVKDLIPALLELMRWSGRYDPRTRMKPQLLQRIADDREGLIGEIRAGFERR